MNIIWEDLPERKPAFTKKSTIMYDMRTGKPVQYYSINTKINLVQKTNYKGETYYRTRSAKEHGLDWAFKASAFGLPNEAAPSEHYSGTNPLDNRQVTTSQISFRITQTLDQKPAPSEDGEKAQAGGWLRRIFRRVNGKSKNS